MKKIYLPLITASTLGLLFATFLVFGSAPRVSALSGSQFNAGHIIDDSIFYDSTSMTAAQIQTFLNSKVPTCDTNGTQMYTSTETRAQYGTSVGYPPPYTCLKSYAQSTPAENAVSGICGYLPAHSSQSAANIIAQVAAACGISPKVILVTLQKEEGLVTDDWPFPSQYKIAMGYGCPDTSACDSQYYGFFNQVYNAAWQFKEYQANPTNFNYVAGQYNNILYNPTLSCGSSSVYIQNQATAGLYDYTPYQPNKAALNNLYGSGDSCSSYGNRNFWRYFTDWFGDTTESKAFKTSSSSTVYLRAAGYKFTVPNMALLQDYGISPGSIQTISQSSADAIPAPDASTNLSTALSYLIKSPSDTDQDGSTVYFVSVGKKYAIKNMQQFNDFGFNTGDISYLPLSLIEYITGTDQLSNYIKMPTNLVFQVGSAQKRPVFQLKTFLSLDSSGVVSPVSYAAAARIPSGDPLTNTGIFIKPAAKPAIYLYTSAGNYYAFPSYDIYTCWNKPLSHSLPYIDLTNTPDYVGAVGSVPTINCIIKDTDTTNYLLSSGERNEIPSAYGSFATNTSASDLLSLAGTIPKAKNTLKEAIKSTTASAVWYLENGTRRLVPSLSNFQLLNLSNSLGLVDNSSLSSLPEGNIKLGTGQVVKPSNSAAVYVISGDTRVAVPSADMFNAYKYSWSNIETFSTQALDAGYPSTGVVLNSYYHDSSTSKDYLFSARYCYSMSTAMLGHYGQSDAAITSAQGYGNIFPNVDLSKCGSATQYAKLSDQSTVYYVDSGTKYPLSSWDAMVKKNGGVAPTITIVSDPSVLNSLPTGAAI